MSLEVVTANKAEDGFDWFVQTIHEDQTASDRITTYSIIHGKPTRDERVLSFLEEGLEDCEVGLLMIPYAFGEVRIAAAYALQAERQALGITKPVVLRQVPRPLTSSPGLGIAQSQARGDAEIEQAIKQAGAKARRESSDIHAPLIAEYKVLREYNLIPLFDLELKTAPEVKYLFVAGTPF